MSSPSKPLDFGPDGAGRQITLARVRAALFTLDRATHGGLAGAIVWAALGERFQALGLGREYNVTDDSMMLVDAEAQAEFGKALSEMGPDKMNAPEAAKEAAKLAFARMIAKR